MSYSMQGTLLGAGDRRSLTAEQYKQNEYIIIPTSSGKTDISTRPALMVHLTIGSLIHGSDCGRKECNGLITPLRKHIYMFTATLKNYNALNERNDSIDRRSLGILAE